MVRGIITLFIFQVFVFSTSNWQNKFSNPLLPSGADPWSITVGGTYYYMHTVRDSLVLWRTKDLTKLADAERKTIWIPPAGKPYSHDLWAPEVHHINNKWYIYFAADEGNNNSHRLWVLENTSEDPFDGDWKLKGKLADPSDKWAIDGSVIQIEKQLYLTWSGWEGDVNGRQNIYLAKMKNPWTVSGNRVKLSSPLFPWELYGDLNSPNDPAHVDVNEGPQFLRHGERIFIIYSASGCWTDHYALGMLSASVKDNLMDIQSWKKSSEPVFYADGTKEGTVNAGHNSFFKSPDGSQDWILYHANEKLGQGCGRFRSPRAQPFTWKENGFPDFGEPAAIDELFEVPAR